jgi:hypothetical protein
MSVQQATDEATKALGNDPNHTVNDVMRLRDWMWQNSRTVGAGGGTGGAGTAGAQPLASSPPTDLGGVHPKTSPYSPQGKRTVQAVETARPMLQALVDDIKAAGLQNDNNAVGTGMSNMLQKHGFSPGSLQTEMLQLASVAEANGFATMTVGRLNLPLVEILKGHLTDAGDSYKLLYDKANGLLQKFPAVLSAVDKAENKRTGGGGAGSGPTSIEVVDPKGGKHTFSSQADADAFKQEAGIR